MSEAVVVCSRIQYSAKVRRSKKRQLQGLLHPEESARILHEGIYYETG